MGLNDHGGVRDGHRRAEERGDPKERRRDRGMGRDPGIECRKHDQLQRNERGQGSHCLVGVLGHVAGSKSVMIIAVAAIRNHGHGTC